MSNYIVDKPAERIFLPPRPVRKNRPVFLPVTAKIPSLNASGICPETNLPEAKGPGRSGPWSICMDYVRMFGDSFAYAKEAAIGRWKEWLLLFIATLLLCIPLFGYVMKVLRGEKPAPEVSGWGTLFTDGIRYLVVSIVYALPAIIIAVVTLGSVVAEILAGNPAGVVPGLEGLLLGLAIFLVVAFICSLFGTIGILRLARTGSIGEAFNFSAIRADIGRIGWINYIIALVLMGIVQLVIPMVLSLLTGIPYAGTLLELVLVAPVAIFEARYLSLVYDQAAARAT